jgi:two-component system NarL family sensor kinase
MTTQTDAHTLLQHNRELGILRHIAETLNRATDLQATLDDTLASVLDLLDLQTAWVFLLDEEGRFYLAASRELPPALAPSSPAWAGGCSCNVLFRQGALKRAINIVQCSRLAEAEGDRCGLEFHASVPLRSEDRLVGILNVASRGSDHFTPDVLELLGAVGYQLGTAIERARLARQAVRLAALEERNRIAREIHDTVAQGLTAITLHLEAAEAIGEHDPAKALRNVRQALGLARTNLEDVRRSVLDLRAAPLETHTLPEALRLLLKDFADETGIQTAFTAAPGIDRLPSAIEMGLYRIAQEALSNVRKHAKPRKVDLSLVTVPGELRLQIEDDGTGFVVETIERSAESGFGIKGMNERAHLLGGRLEVCSKPRKGTRIEAIVPHTS